MTKKVKTSNSKWKISIQEEKLLELILKTKSSGRKIRMLTLRQKTHSRRSMMPRKRERKPKEMLLSNKDCSKKLLLSKEQSWSLSSESLSYKAMLMTIPSHQKTKLLTKKS